MKEIGLPWHTSEYMAQYLRMATRVLGGTFAALYLLVIVASPLVILSTHHEHGNHAHCPFQLDGEAGLCSMTVVEHLTHFATAFAGIIPTLLLCLVVCALLLTFPWQLFAPPRPPRRARTGTPTFVPRYVDILIGTTLFTRAP